MRKLFNRTLVLLALILGAYSYSIISGIPRQDNQAYAYAIDAATGEVVEIQTPQVTGIPQNTFTRGNTRNEPIHWTKNPCRDSRTNEYYESEMISRAEILYELKLVGFTGQMVENFAAISLAESSRQLSCVADEHLTNSTWDISYGVWAIRAVKAEQGKGTCRDIERLRKNDFHDQTVCAFEISGQGKSFQPWSVTHKKRGKPYLKYIGK